MRLFRLALVLTLLSPAAFPQGKDPLTQDQAQKLIPSLTRIGGCQPDEQYDFHSVLTAPAENRKISFGQIDPTRVYAVRTSYGVHCTEGNHNMKYGEVTEWHFDVQGNLYFYQDEFKTWQLLESGLDDTQYWKDPTQNIRCRAKRLAYLTYDAKGQVIKRRLDPDTTTYGDCTVSFKNPNADK
jgi:hypothetical protein